MPSVAWMTPSQMSLTVKTPGLPPASKTPLLTSSISDRKWNVPGWPMPSALSTSTCGLPRSSSVQFIPRRSASPWWFTMRRRWLRSRSRGIEWFPSCRRVVTWPWQALAVTCHEAVVWLSRHVKSDHRLDASRPAENQVRRLLRWVAAGDERRHHGRPAQPEGVKVPERGCEGICPGVHRAQHYLVLQHHVPHEASRVRLDEGLHARDAGEHEDPICAEHLQAFKSEMRMPDRLVDQIDVAHLFRQVRERHGLGGDIGRADGSGQVGPGTRWQLP